MRKLIIMFLFMALILCGCASNPGGSNNSAPDTNAGQQVINDEDWWKAIDTSNGLYLVVCETGENEYKCTVLPQNDKTVDEERKRVGAKWMSEKQIKEILPWYKLSDDRIVIKPYTDPKSSYVSLDKGKLLDKMEALFGNKYKVGQQYRDAWERLKNSQ
ncbi:MAG: hypothetical protein IJM39_07160 [Firmicutes bacterium]|nr:hypothetical protein [Bacillota bacterium]